MHVCSHCWNSLPPRQWLPEGQRASRRHLDRLRMTTSSSSLISQLVVFEKTAFLHILYRQRKALHSLVILRQEAPVNPTSFKCRPRSTSTRDPSKSCRLSYSGLVSTIGKQPETLVNTNNSLYEVAHEKIPLHRKSLLSLIKYLIHTNTLSSFLLSHPLTK